MKILRSEDRGHASHGWLEAHHSFSFGEYFDPDRMQFGVLRVLNQDRILAGKGFPTHGHRDMEIVTYVLEGILEHKDSMGNGSQMKPGEVQLMSAGRGVMHSEFNPSKEENLHLLQMWVMPSERGTTPRYEQSYFSEEARRNTLRLVVSPDGAEDSLTIGQDARMYAGLLDGGLAAQWTLEPGRQAWLHLAEGTVQLQGQKLKAGDGAMLQTEGRWTFSKADKANVVLWDMPADAASD